MDKNGSRGEVVVYLNCLMGENGSAVVVMSSSLVLVGPRCGIWSWGLLSAAVVSCRPRSPGLPLSPMLLFSFSVVVGVDGGWCACFGWQWVACEPCWLTLCLCLCEVVRRREWEALTGGAWLPLSLGCAFPFLQESYSFSYHDLILRNFTMGYCCKLTYCELPFAMRSYPVMC